MGSIHRGNRVLADGTEDQRWYLHHKHYVGNVTSYTVAGFPNNGTQYRWAVAAGDSGGYNASAFVTFTSGTSSKPPAPVKSYPASGAAVSGTSITFQWHASAGATGYWLAVQKVSDGSYIINQALGNVTGYTVNGFPNNNTQYRWAVAAGNSAGYTSSAFTTFTSGSVTKPAAPALTYPASGNAVASTSINFLWEASTGATGYWLTVQKVSDSTYIINQYVGGVTNYMLAGFPNNGTGYRWAVAAGNSAGYTSSAFITFTNGISKPAAPVQTYPVINGVAGCTSITFQWEASTGATGYWLTVKKTSDSSTVFDGYVGNVLSSTVSGFTNSGAFYTWAVAAGNSSGYTASAFHSFNNTSVLPLAPVLVFPAYAGKATGTNIVFRWNPSEGATGYWLTVKYVSSGATVINKYVDNVLSSNESGFPNNNTQYWWTVAAGNCGGYTAADYMYFTNGP